MLRRFAALTLALSAAALLWPREALYAAEPAPPKVTTPKAHFGFNLGDDYCLANYEQYTTYLAKLEKESDRLKVVSIGKTAEGRPQLMAVVTSPANHKKLDRYRDIARTLADADGVAPEVARKLAAEGKAVVWIDGGLHASETLCAQVLAETVYQFVSATDAELLRILDDVVILFVHANPDGHDLVADWYMREKDPKKRSLGGLPRLYQKYIGHDNNRDFYANTQAETRNMNHVMYREWLPQIVYNHHQTGPPGTVLFCPPFRDPFNYNFDPLVVSGIDAVGAAMMQRFLAEDKPGATTRSGARYSTWFNGGLRTTAYFHNMIGLLTETIGSPTPARVPFNPALQLPKADLLAPVAPQEWHFRQSVEYSVTANKAVLDYASRHREQLLHNIWLMGKNAIARGNKDSWTVTPKMVAAAKGARGADAFQKFFRDPAKRDARAYVIPADQPDFLTATKFVNALLGTGVKVHQATDAFTAGGKKYPAGSYVVKCAQAVRAHVLDMFEPQDHPDDFAYPGAPPTPPYDAAGYTLAFQMGVRFDRVLEAVEGPFAPITSEFASPVAAKVTDAGAAVGFFLDPRANDSFVAVNRLLAAGEDVRRLKEPQTVAGTKHPAGAFYVARKATTVPLLQKLAEQLGTPFVGSKEAPGKGAVALKPARIALVDRYGGSMPSGWTRWLFEQFEYPFVVVYPPDLDRGKLRDQFDVIVVVDGLVGARGAGGGGDQPPEPNVVDDIALPADYRGRRGSITATKTVPELKKFVEAGGTLLTIGSSTGLANQLGLKVDNHLVEKADGKEKPLGRDKFYVPPSVLRMKIDPAHPLAWGMDDEVDVMFANSPTFRAPAVGSSLERVGWFAGKSPLRSGWAFGQEHLDGGVAVLDAPLGKGRVVAYGSQVLYRAQPHATFKLVFNAIARASATREP